MILYRHKSRAFSEEAFRASGAMVAVVLNFNKSGTIARAVESAFGQQWPCYEILAMDDASTDGSDVEMLEAVIQCVSANSGKALRVTVVRNAKNLTTLGQWRQAATLSDGAWFGMFCGDDVSLPDRMSVAAGLIAANAEAAGVCTNFTDIGSSKMHKQKGFFIKTVRDYAWPSCADTIMGCTAFWRRDVLELDLPEGTMDDFVLTWTAVISRKGSLVWDFNRSTVRYGVGGGVTTIDTYGTDGDASFAGLCRKYTAIKKRGRRFGRKVWDGIKRFDDRYGTDRIVSAQVRGHWIASWTEGGGWFERLKAVWTMFVIDRRNNYGGCRGELAKKTAGRFIVRFFGKAGFAAAYWLRAKCRKGKSGV